MPFCSGPQNFQGAGVAVACFTANGKFGHKNGGSDKKQCYQINYDKRGAAVFADHVRKFPNIAKANSTAHGCQNESNAAAELLAL